MLIRFFTVGIEPSQANRNVGVSPGASRAGARRELRHADRGAAERFPAARQCDSDDDCEQGSVRLRTTRASRVRGMRSRSRLRRYACSDEQDGTGRRIDRPGEAHSPSVNGVFILSSLRGVCRAAAAPWNMTCYSATPHGPSNDSDVECRHARTDIDAHQRRDTCPTSDPRGRT